MLKNNYKFIKIFNFVFLLILLSYSTSYAITTGTVFLSTSKKTIEVGEEIEVAINIENTNTAAFTSYLNFDDTKLEYISGPEKTNAIGNRIISVWYDETGGNFPKDGELTKYKFKAKEEQGTNLQTDNSSLKALRIDIEGIVPNFEKDVHEYYLTTQKDINQIEILAISENPNAKIEITGNTNLETLAIENVLLTPPFDTTITHYDVKISNEIFDLNLLAVPENEQAKVEIIGKDNLKEGNNKILITVTAQNEFTKKEYVINAYKRNQKEEEEYIAKQNEEQARLEEAYQIEEVSDKKENTQNKLNRAKEELYIIVALFVIIVIALLIKYKFFQKNNNI